MRPGFGVPGIYSNLVAADRIQHQVEEHHHAHPPVPKKPSPEGGDGGDGDGGDGNEFGRFKRIIMRWWENKDVVAICTVLAGAGTIINVAQQRDQIERQERVDEENRIKAAEESARNSAERKISVVRGALTVKLDPPEPTLPMCDLYEAEALINRLVQRSPVLVNGYQGTGKSTLLSRMVASRRSDTDITFNQPAYRLSLRKCLRDRGGEPGILFRLIAEEIGLGKAVQEGFVVDDFNNAQQYFVGALEQLRRDGYEPCMFVVDDVEILFNESHPELSKQAGGWCEWLLELHEAGLLRLVMATSAGGVYLDLIKFSGFEARLERAHMPELPESRIVRYLINRFNPHTSDADSLSFDEESAHEFAKIFTGFTDILFATSSPTIHEYCESRLRHAQLKIKKAIQLDASYREIFSHIPCELSALENSMPRMKLSEIERRLDYLVDRGIIAWTGMKIVWNRKLVREAYNRMTENERSKAERARVWSNFLSWPMRLFGYGSQSSPTRHREAKTAATAATAAA
ncbi:hypothetical protein THASP1DRAFT_31155 [Thamnocephalis sphaerospora]|uniref:Uncharacterized protein n=1 Tax=Thamnocephalis sphaerospora TaxID=78915 RepID=A0A4P9XMA2_9FUNG|nr:hypothetical protein THASP1DRAFT_31155 [Thamnocephalis sphaerospora]|eukprot:RKP07028.1 hypothetical protein THASP1DRAFT_31155 [Thamnocephalis sphaerospora]